MTILEDFKTQIGVEGNDNNDYYIKSFISPAIKRLSGLSANLKLTKVELQTGVKSYDLTNVGDPPVDPSGIYDLVLDGEYCFDYDYKREVVLRDPTTLEFLNADTPINGSLYLKYKAFFSDPIWVDPTYTETDAPSHQHAHLADWASAYFGLKSLNGNVLGGSVGSGAIVSKSEDNLRVGYGSFDSRQKGYRTQMQIAEDLMRGGASFDFFFFSKQIV